MLQASDTEQLVYTFVLVVTKYERTASVSTTVTILRRATIAFPPPLLAIQPIQSKIAWNNKLVVNGSVLSEDPTGATLRWDVRAVGESDIESVDVASIATTPVSGGVLVVGANSLAPGGSYRITLTASDWFSPTIGISAFVDVMVREV